MEDLQRKGGMEDRERRGCKEDRERRGEQRLEVRECPVGVKGQAGPQTARANKDLLLPVSARGQGSRVRGQDQLQ